MRRQPGNESVEGDVSIASRESPMRPRRGEVVPQEGKERSWWLCEEQVSEGRCLGEGVGAGVLLGRVGGEDICWVMVVGSATSLSLVILGSVYISAEWRKNCEGLFLRVYVAEGAESLPFGLLTSISLLLFLDCALSAVPADLVTVFKFPSCLKKITLWLK